MPKKVIKKQTQDSKLDLKGTSQGKRDVDCKRIVDSRKRINTLWKRKRGLFKKASTLASMCDQQVFIALFDPRTRKLTQASTETSLTSEAIFKYMNDEDTAVTEVKPEEVDDNQITVSNVTIETTKTCKLGRVTRRKQKQPKD